jgi:hypothetical protein
MDWTFIRGTGGQDIHMLLIHHQKLLVGSARHLAAQNGDCERAWRRAKNFSNEEELFLASFVR